MKPSETMENKINSRMDWVDYGKGIGIILVVYGHLLSSAYHAGLGIPTRFFSLSDSIVYSFHMPLFFFLSGIFVESSLNKHGTKDYLLNKLGNMAYPYFVWSILQMSVEVMFSSQTQKGTSISDILAIPYQPWAQFWFLYALFLMNIVYVLLSRTGKYSAIITFMVAIGLFFYPFNTGIFALYSFSEHFIFFTGGMLLKKYFTTMEKFNPPLWIVASLFVVFAGSAYFTFEYKIDPQRLANGGHPFYFLYLAILGITACVSLAQYLSNRNIFPFLKTLGIYSLQIYLVHMLAGVGMRVVLLDLFKLNNWILQILIGVAFALTAPIVLLKVSQKINFPYLFTLRRNSNSILD